MVISQFQYEKIRNEILETGRDVKIIAVSKTKPRALVLEFLELGQKIFGENKIQEGTEKFLPLKEQFSLELHHIGPFQTGTAKKLFGIFDFTHGLSTISHVETLLKLGEKFKKNLGFFLQVNLTGEDSKNGFSPVEIRKILPGIGSYQNEFVRFKGLMTMGPTNEDPLETRQTFRNLHQIREEYCPEALLSMGMSGDYKIALEEKTDILRIGSLFFGER